MLFFLLFISCSNINFTSNEKFYFYGKTLQVGDILLKRRKLNFTSIFGHSALIIAENIVADMPKYGDKYYEIDLFSWLQDNRDILVLRYKKISPIFQKKLLKNLENIKIGLTYGISFDKMKTDRMYCSQLIWYLFFVTAADLGENLDIDSNGGFIVFPYDFLESNELERITFN